MTRMVSKTLLLSIHFPAHANLHRAPCAVGLQHPHLFVTAELSRGSLSGENGFSSAQQSDASRRHMAEPALPRASHARWWHALRLDPCPCRPGAGKHSGLAAAGGVSGGLVGSWSGGVSVRQGGHRCAAACCMQGRRCIVRGGQHALISCTRECGALAAAPAGVVGTA